MILGGRRQIEPRAVFMESLQGFGGVRYLKATPAIVRQAPERQPSAPPFPLGAFQSPWRRLNQ